MTDKQFWMKLDQLTYRKNNHSVLAEFKATLLIKQATTENLSILVPGSKGAPYRQNVGEDLVYFLCYSSRKQAQEDKDNNGMWSSYPVSKVHSEILSDPKCGGIIFNYHSDSHIMIITTDLLTTPDEELNKLIMYLESDKLLKIGRAHETELKRRIANGEVIPEEYQKDIEEHSKLLNALDAILHPS